MVIHSFWSPSPPSRRQANCLESGAVMMKTNALCQAEKAACDELMAQFAELQRQIQQHMQAGGGGT